MQVLRIKEHIAFVACVAVADDADTTRSVVGYVPGIEGDAIRSGERPAVVGEAQLCHRCTSVPLTRWIQKKPSNQSRHKTWDVNLPDRFCRTLTAGHV